MSEEAIRTTKGRFIHFAWLVPAVLLWRLCVEIYIRLGRRYGR